jgi:hypothetical protein
MASLLLSPQQYYTCRLKFNIVLIDNRAVASHQSPTSSFSMNVVDRDSIRDYTVFNSFKIDLYIPTSYRIGLLHIVSQHAEPVTTNAFVIALRLYVFAFQAETSK